MTINSTIIANGIMLTFKVAFSDFIIIIQQIIHFHDQKKSQI